MTQDRHGEINDNTALMLENAQHPLKRMDRSNVPAHTTRERLNVVFIDMVFPAGLWIEKEDE